MGQFIELQSADGHRFQAYVAQPAGKARGAIVIAPEIFGVNSHIRAVTDGYAADGYLAIAPALFDRAQRGYDTGYSPDEIQAGVAVMQKVSLDDALRDVETCVAHVAGAGKVGIVGYCWGGLLTWRSACGLEGLSAAVPYYPGGLTQAQDIARRPQVPVLAHLSDRDQWVPMDGVEAFRQAHPDVEVHVYPAHHGFNCDQRGTWDAPSARLARERTLAFFARHVG